MPSTTLVRALWHTRMGKWFRESRAPDIVRKFVGHNAMSQPSAFANALVTHPWAVSGDRRALSDDRTRRSRSDGSKTTMPISAADTSQETQDRSGYPVGQDSLLLRV